MEVQEAEVEHIAVAAMGMRAFAAAQRTQEGVSPELADADASLDARDRLLKALDAKSANRVMTWVSARATRPIPLGVIGELVETADGKSQCTVSIDGAVHPELVPEWEAWSGFFLFKGHRTEDLLGPDGRFSQEYVTAQRHHLGISADEAERLLTLAADTAALLLEEPPTTSSPAERTTRFIQITMEARRLVRSEFQPATWAAVWREVNRVKRGTIYDFPPYVKESSVNR